MALILFLKVLTYTYSLKGGIYMGLRFRKSIKLAPGVKLNIGKKSSGISVGGKRNGNHYYQWG